MFKRRKSGSDSGEVPADEVVTDEVVVEEVVGDEQPAAESTSEGPSTSRTPQPTRSPGWTSVAFRSRSWTTCS